MEARRELLLKVISRDRPHCWSRNGGVETMAIAQRDDPPSRCALRRTRRRTDTIEVSKRRAAEKKAEEEKKKAEARVCAARCRLKRCPPINRNRRGRNGRKSCARSTAANHGFARRADECGIISNKEKRERERSQYRKV